MMGGSGSSSSDSCVLKLKGLPYSTTEEQVLDFFSGFRIRKVAFVPESDGRPSGLAMQKNGEYIGDRYVKLLHVPTREMDEQVKYGTAAIPKHGQLPVIPNLQAQLPHSQIQHHLSGLQQALGQAGVGLCALSTGIPLSWVSSDLIQLPLNHNLHTNPVPMQVGMGSLNPGPQNSPAPSIQNDGSTIKIRGLPFRAKENDILEFFREYDVLSHSVHIGVDGSGRPTGDGWITFSNQEEAKRAVRERNKKYLQHRYLELSPMQPWI